LPAFGDDPMNNEQMHAAVLALPEPDLMLESRLED
jgi:hypothetical protein